MEPNNQQSNQPAPATPQQQPIVQPVAPPQPLAQPRKRMPKWAKILIIIGSIGLVASIVAVIAVSVILKDNDKEAQGFLSSIYSSDYSTAYDYFSPQLKDVQSRDVFETQIKALKIAGVDSSCETDWTTNSSTSSTETGDTKEIAGSLDCENGTFGASFKFVKQNDNYKLYSYSIQPK